ncbi:hypothetical protein [Mycobacterium avium]|uniref:hypothetical protein n=1 Tax=Mycobacterium avium TaxID=1764 RepID=UPI001CC4D0EE|nr:hypothetical protein [Mycobacterium avium]MBZ4581147.1 hypothetical protein [Mycobacterium avium subsp. hominissuis]MBZ4609059.1 hypothetical protein [Mycobacterium avium subsp. hominissuis]
MDAKLVGEVYAWVMKERRERSSYSGRGESRVATGRECDATGASVSGVESVIVSDLLGVTPGATVVMPDALAADVPVGTVIGLTGSNGLSARIVGGDYGSTRVSVFGVTEVRVIADGAKLIRDAATKQASASRGGSAAQS